MGLKENKGLMFKLYKLFLIDELYKDLKEREEKQELERKRLENRLRKQRKLGNGYSMDMGDLRKSKFK